MVPGLSQFPAAYRSQVSTAVDEAGAHWNNARSQHQKNWPELVSDQQPERFFVLYTAGLGPGAPDPSCPGNQLLHRAAANGPVPQPNGVVEQIAQIYEFYGCSGSLVETFSPNSLFTDPDNLFNLIAHEIGHLFGAGHSNCANGLMNGDGSQLFDGSRKAIAPAECDAIDRMHTLYSIGGTTVGNAPGELLSLQNEIIYSGGGSSEELMLLLPGGFAFSERAPDTSTYRVAPPIISNSEKTCTVSGGQDTVNGSDVTSINVACSCVPGSSAQGGGTGSGSLGEQGCDDPPLNGTLRRLYQQHPATLCQRVPRACSGPTYFWWWLISGPPGPIGPNGPGCQGQTDCVPGPPQCHDLDGDGEAETCGESLDCTDRCVAGSSVTLQGPLIHLTSSGSGSEVEVEGWILDRDGISDMAFFVDEQPVTLSDFQDGLYRPEPCASPQAPGGAGCDPFSGFSGTLDVSQFSPGTHRLQLAATDDPAVFAAPTAVEHLFEVTPCGDTERPTVSISSPSAGDVLVGPETVWADADDNVGVDRVAFYIDGVRQEVDFSEPFSYEWNTQSFADGPHTLRARAYDACENRRDSAAVPVTVDNAGSALRVELEAPEEGAVISGPNSSVRGWAYHPQGMSLVEVRLDGALIPTEYGISRPGVCQLLGVNDPVCPVGFRASFDSRLYADGPHQTRVTATSTSGVSASAPATGEPSRSFEILNDFAPCAAAGHTLCLRNQRFELEMEFVEMGTVYSANADPYDDRNGLYWFYNEDNPDAAVKVIGPDPAGYFWLFHAALTDREYTLRVRDTETGAVKSYQKPEGSYCGGADHRAFPALSSPLATFPFASPPRSYIEIKGQPGPAAGAGQPCEATATRVCLHGDRFQVEVYRGGQAQAATPLTPLSGAFTFFALDNLELVVKILDGTVVNGRFWVFYGALTNVEYSVVVTDTLTGASRQYDNPAGNYCGMADTSAF